MSGLLERSASRVPYRVDNRVLANLASGLVVASVVIAFLYFGRAVFEPLALAVVLSLVLAPIVRRLRRWGIGRATSVIATVLLAVAALGGLGYVMATQITDLAGELPRYESNLRDKARALGGSTLTSGALEKASGTLKELQKEMAKPDPAAGAPGSVAPAPGSAPDAGAAAPKPVLVEVREPEPTPLQSVRDVLEPTLPVLATLGLVILFLGFILMQREDLRDRLVKLAGAGDLQRSTVAMNDAAKRLSKFFLIQTGLNAGFGVCIGIGLWIIGVPNPILWGVLAGLMRFVPFIGAWIAALFPVILAAAVDPGWTMVIATAALFLVLEPLAGQVVEPMVYGHNTGLSPGAVVIATLFWALLWGPVGLLLATPITVCLVVLGKHIEGLAFFDVLLGDEPALLPEERFYQRVLAGDATEAADQAEQQLKTQALSTYYDAVPMKALALAQTDAAGGKVSREQQLEIRDTIEEVAEDLADYADAAPDSPAGAEGIVDGDEDDAPKIAPISPSVAPDTVPDAWRVPHQILCIPARSALDQSACTLLTHLLRKHGLSARVEPYDAGPLKSLPEESRQARIVCLSYFGAAANPAPVRYAIRRLKRVMPAVKFIAGFWLLSADEAKAEAWRTAVGADFVATTLAAATAICVEEAIKAGAELIPAGGTPIEEHADAEAVPA